MAKAFGGLGTTAGLAADRTSISGMSAGQQFFETDTKLLWYYDGSAWQRVHPAGSVIQTISTTYSTPETITATSATSYFSATITPRFVSSKVLVELCLDWNKAEYYTGHCQIFRNANNISAATSYGNRVPSFMSIRYWGTGSVDSTNLNYATWSNSKSYLDSPASISAQTYDVKFFTQNSGYPLYLNRSRGDADSVTSNRGFSSLILKEIMG